MPSSLQKAANRCIDRETSSCPFVEASYETKQPIPLTVTIKYKKRSRPRSSALQVQNSMPTVKSAKTTPSTGTGITAHHDNGDESLSAMLRNLHLQKFAITGTGDLYYNENILKNSVYKNDCKDDYHADDLQQCRNNARESFNDEINQKLSLVSFDFTETEEDVSYDNHLRLKRRQQHDDITRAMDVDVGNDDTNTITSDSCMNIFDKCDLDETISTTFITPPSVIRTSTTQTIASTNQPSIIYDDNNDSNDLPPILVVAIMPRSLPTPNFGLTPETAEMRKTFLTLSK